MRPQEKGAVIDDRSSQMCGAGIRTIRVFSCEAFSQRSAGAELAAVCDPMKGKAEACAKELGIAKWTENPYDLLEDHTIDAVIIVTPTSTHAEMIMKAAENGKHIFVEKPLTLSLEESKEVMKKSKKRASSARSVL